MRERILRIVRDSLDRGMTIEIEGLGTFRRSAVGKYVLEPETQPQVFVAYVGEDLELARRLCDALREAGCSPWLDKDKLLPGQDWPRALERAIEVSDVFVACFHRGPSPNGVNFKVSSAMRWNARGGSRWTRRSWFPFDSSRAWFRGAFRTMFNMWTCFRSGSVGSSEWSGLFGALLDIGALRDWRIDKRRRMASGPTIQHGRL
jgi:hypothetical protein